MKVVGLYKDLIGKLVRTTHDIHLNSGKIVPAGTVGRIASTWRGRFVLEETEREKHEGYVIMKIIVRRLHPREFELVE